MVVDDHPLLREGVAAAVDRQPDMQLVAEAANGKEAIERFREFQPDITLMDLQMPEMNGIDAIAAIRRERPHARIIVLTTHAGDVQAIRAFKAGAQGYLLKSMVRKELVDTIHAVHAGHRRIPPAISSAIAEHVAEDHLSDREIAVLGYAAKGCANKIIAAHLGISEDTVKVHMKNIFAKLDANDRTHAVTIALSRGILGG
jgi:DNA-binding NarL/FixJ family response regulator